MKVIEVVPGASHLFEEAAALERVVDSASRWFSLHLHARKLAAIA